jgi:hypothetical protein
MPAKIFLDELLVLDHYLTTPRVPQRCRNNGTIGIHKGSCNDMEKEAKFEIFDGLKREFFVELVCSLVVPEQQKLDHPIEHKVEDAGDGVEDGQTTAVHQAAPEVGEQLGIDVMTENLRAGI